MNLEKNRAVSALSLLPEPSDGAPNCHSTGSIERVSAASFNFATVFATPNANGLPLHCKLPTELTEILAVLTHLHLLYLLPQTSTISGAIFPNNTRLLCSLCHFGRRFGGAETLDSIRD